MVDAKLRTCNIKIKHEPLCDVYGVRDGVEPVVEDGAPALGHRRGREEPERLQRRHDPTQDDRAPELLVLLHTDSLTHMTSVEGDLGQRVCTS